MDQEDKCLRCGQCCFMPDLENFVPTTTPCPYLRFDDQGKTFCSIYEHRLGTRLAPGVICGMRHQDPFDYENCPYNTGDSFRYRVNRETVELLPPEK